MSLIQRALEKGDDERNKKQNQGSTIAKAQQKVERNGKTPAKSKGNSSKTSPEKTKELQAAARKLETFDPEVTPQAPESLIGTSAVKTSSSTTYKKRPYNKTRYFVVGFIFLFMTVALAACYFLALEMAAAWNGTGKPETTAERVTTVEKVQSPAKQSLVEKSASTQAVAKRPEKEVQTVSQASSVVEKKLPYKLSGITLTGGVKYALINNKILQAGDKIDSFSTVESIGTKEVIILFQGKEVRLEL